MQAVSLSLFRFDRTAARLWAFSQMQFAKRRLRSVDDLSFFKLFGTGTGEGFTPLPNLSVYAILATWPSLATARARQASAPIFQAYRDHAAEAWTVYLEPVSSRGAWDGKRPFAVDREGPMPSPVVALTRATVRPTGLVQFWKRVPNISRDIGTDPTVLFKVGMGEVPWTQQVTFSIWPDTDSMRSFARRSALHGEAAKAALDHGWFKEDLFARFALCASEGSWGGHSTAVEDALAQSQKLRVRRPELVMGADAA